MPFVTINIRQNTSSVFRNAVSDAIHEGMVAVLGSTPDARLHVFHELPKGFMLHEPVVYGQQRGEHFMFIQINMWPQPAEIKKELVASIRERLAGITDITAQDAAFLIIDSPVDSWLTTAP